MIQGLLAKKSTPGGAHEQKFIRVYARTQALIGRRQAVVRRAQKPLSTIRSLAQGLQRLPERRSAQVISRAAGESWVAFMVMVDPPDEGKLI